MIPKFPIPIFLKFKTPLSKERFDHLVRMLFDDDEKNGFRLWGNPIHLGPTKIQVYGVDKHIWQPVLLELTAKYLLFIGSISFSFLEKFQKEVEIEKVYIGAKEYSLEEYLDGIKSNCKGI